MRRTLYSFAIVSFALIGTACGSGGNAASSTATSAPVASSASTTVGSGRTASAPTITISQSFMFASRPVVAGTTVTVLNRSSAEHTVSADTTAGGFDITVKPGQTATFPAPDRPGLYAFHCNIHNFMHGTLRVT